MSDASETFTQIQPEQAGEVALASEREREGALAAARALMENDLAPGTRAKYESCLRAFKAFSMRQAPKVPTFPAHPAIVGLYIGALRARGLAKSTIGVHVAAIADEHDRADVPAPWTQSADLRRQLQGLRRAKDVKKQHTEALEVDLAARVADAGDDDLIGRRDRALFCLGWLSAQRRSNLRALRVRDVAIKTDPLDGQRYLEIFLAYAKNDQTGRGRHMALTELPAGQPLCAVRALDAYLTIAGIRADANAPLFQGVRRRPGGGHEVNGRAISGEMIRLIFRKMLENAGIEDPQRYAPHSLRRGFVTTADENGVPRALTMEYGGWKTSAMLDTYSRIPKARSNPVRLMFPPIPKSAQE